MLLTFRYGLAVMALATFMAFEPPIILGQQRPKPAAGQLQVGDAAPDFALTRLDGKEKVQLKKLQGKPVVLIFGSCT